MNGKGIDFPTTPNISDCLDEDDMASNSATKLATQQSIKAYVYDRAGIGISNDVLTKYEYYNAGDDLEFAIAGLYHQAQTFTPSASHRVTHVKVKLYRQGDGSGGNFTVSLRAVDVDGHPTGSDLKSTTMAATGVSTSTAGTWYTFYWGAGYDLVASTKYAIVIIYAGGSVGSDAIHWLMDDSSPTYAGGNHEEQYSTGAWSAYATDDFMFEEWNSFQRERGLWVDGTDLHYVDGTGAERYLTGTPV